MVLVQLLVGEDETLIQSSVAALLTGHYRIALVADMGRSADDSFLDPVAHPSVGIRHCCRLSQECLVESRSACEARSEAAHKWNASIELHVDLVATAVKCEAAMSYSVGAAVVLSKGERSMKNSLGYRCYWHIGP
jgi:hypothetical protein